MPTTWTTAIDWDHRGSYINLPTPQIGTISPYMQPPFLC
jgi:hypothetical protein